MKYWVSVNGKKYEVEVERKGDYVPLRKSYETAVMAPVMTEAVVPAASISSSAAPEPVDRQASKAQAKGSSEEGILKSPFPGKVLDVKVQPGQSVSQGNTLLVIEAMKMETELAAPLSGIVEEIRVNPGDKVETGDLLVRISAE